MKARRLWIVGMSAAIGVVISIAATAVGQHSFTMKDVLKRWEARQNRVRSARFTLDEHRIVAKGSMGRPRRARPDDAGPFPKEDLSYQTTQIVTFDGAKIRYSYDGPAWNVVEGKLIDASNVTAFNGEKAKYYSLRGALGFPVGTIMPGSPQGISTLLAISPLFLTYRATYPGMQHQFKISEFEKTGEVTSFDGNNCVALRLNARPPARGEDTLWVDPERDFLVRRYTSSVDGKVHLQLDITYEADAQQGWVPSGWRFVYHNSKGGFQESGDTKVTKYALNTPIDAREFELTFPPGTVVNEHSEGKVEAYVLKPGDERRVITEADKGKSYEDVLNEDGKRKAVWKTVAGFLAFGLIIALVVPRLRRLYRSRKVSV